MEVIEMAGTAGIPFGERKYLTINDTSAYMGLGVTKLKNIIKGGKFKEYITAVSYTHLDVYKRQPLDH